MSTRATYQMDGMTFYCHWDGCPTGAAARFAKMIAAHTVAEKGEGFDEIERRRGGFAFAFIRGNMDAEQCAEHDDIGGTEYRYTLHIDAYGAVSIRVEHCTVENDKDVWSAIYAGDLAAWLDAMRTEHAAQSLAYYTRYPNPPKTPADTEREALEIIPRIARAALANGGPGGPFIRYATVKEATAIKQRLGKQANLLQSDNPNKAAYLEKMRGWWRAIDAANAVKVTA